MSIEKYIEYDNNTTKESGLHVTPDPVTFGTLCQGYINVI